jgi:hypothetical protein
VDRDSPAMHGLIAQVSAASQLDPIDFERQCGLQKIS